MMLRMHIREYWKYEYSNGNNAATENLYKILFAIEPPGKKSLMKLIYIIIELF